MSFFVSNSIKDVIDEKTYLSQDVNIDSDFMFYVKCKNKILFAKSSFESIKYNKQKNIKSINFSLNSKEIKNILFQNNFELEINIATTIHKSYLLKLLKITKVKDDKYYCQYKVLGEKND